MDYIDDTVGWGASLEAEFQDNTNWDFDVSDEDDLDQFGGDVFSELAELEHMVQQCTLAEPGGYACLDMQQCMLVERVLNIIMYMK